ncbi:MAG: hypothetical protein A2X34_05410 [Elusimicrobia bacterium GWC2_51_8]|nr:MAG: hypothetical protein A2X33_00810 [Elusimicrobia bacterium GWA2_51_34]OGR59178.1 MAG: hypothetical protein A2X34_05410 [Elusimicrobia bacterium GWC2_51_8]OGR84502.1 MAG: hypothetical protein A2021_03090 [Elusimicrobia bacterium GWF2_52_66]
MIERNKNANVVHYDANLTADGKLNPREPVVAYWVMLAGDGSRKKLNWLEKKKAYGIKIKPDPSRPFGPKTEDLEAGHKSKARVDEPKERDPSLNGYIITLAAAPWMPLTMKKIGEAVRAEVIINGRPAILAKMFIQARDRLLGPKVEYIELYGKDLQTGEACREKILPK